MNLINITIRSMSEDILEFHLLKSVNMHNQEQLAARTTINVLTYNMKLQQKKNECFFTSVNKSIVFNLFYP